MEITFNPITANRVLGKSMRRYFDTIEALERTGVFVPTENLPFDTLQVIMLDRDPSYARADRPKDRILQFEVAAPSTSEVNYADAKAFVGYFADRLKVAINGCGLPKETAIAVTENIEAFKRTL